MGRCHLKLQGEKRGLAFGSYVWNQGAIFLTTEKERLVSVGKNGNNVHIARECQRGQVASEGKAGSHGAGLRVSGKNQRDRDNLE